MGLKVVDIGNEPGFEDASTITRQALPYRIPEHSDETIAKLIDAFLMAEATAGS